MKKVFLMSMFLSLLVLAPCFSISPDDFHYAYGQWDLTGDRLVQNDLKAGMARVDIPYTQKGIIMYQFNVQYRAGGPDDNHAGFGIHIFVDNPAPGKAWGNGKSNLDLIIPELPVFNI